MAAVLFSGLSPVSTGEATFDRTKLWVAEGLTYASSSGKITVPVTEVTSVVACAQYDEDEVGYGDEHEDLYVAIRTVDLATVLMNESPMGDYERQEFLRKLERASNFREMAGVAIDGFVVDSLSTLYISPKTVLNIRRQDRYGRSVMRALWTMTYREGQDDEGNSNQAAG